MADAQVPGFAAGLSDEADYMPTGMEPLGFWGSKSLLAVAARLSVVSYAASLPCCGQRQHSGHSCTSAGAGVGPARGSRMYMCLMRR